MIRITDEDLQLFSRLFLIVIITFKHKDYTFSKIMNQSSNQKIAIAFNGKVFEK
jgi:hypothetical protein